MWLRISDPCEESKAENEPARMVLMHTQFGGTRMIDILVSDPLPRICQGLRE
jgi:hypothetical protein